MKSENSKKNKYASSNDNYLQKLKNMLIKITEKIKNNNTLKFSLKNNPNFDCQLLFKEMDPIQKQYINSQDFIDFFKKFSINLNEQIIRRLIQQYDKHSHFKLIYDDFVVLVFGQNKIGMNKSNNNILNNDTVSLFYKILKNEFDLIFLVNEMILDVRNCDNFITYEAFISIANNGKNIDKNLMKSFLEDKFDYKDINYLIYYLDTNNDGLITYDDFEDFFMALTLSQEEIINIKNNELNLINKNERKMKENNVVKNNFENDLIKNKKIINNEENNDNFQEKENNEYNKYANINAEDNSKNLKNNIEIENNIKAQKNIKEMKYSQYEKYKRNLKLNDIDELNYNNIQENNNKIIEKKENRYKTVYKEETEEDNDNKNTNNNEHSLTENKDMYDNYTFLKNKYSFNEGKVTIINDNNKKKESDNYEDNIIYHNDNDNENNIDENKVNNLNEEEKISEDNIIYHDNQEKQENKYTYQINKNSKFQYNNTNEIIYNKMDNTGDKNKMKENQEDVRINVKNYKNDIKNRDYYYNSSINENANDEHRQYTNERGDGAYDSQNENNVKETSNNDYYIYSNSNNDMDNYYMNEGGEYDNNQNYKNNMNSENINSNEYNNNNILSSNNYSGNMSSTDYNKSDNYVIENNINNYQKYNTEQTNNEINLRGRNNMRKDNNYYNDESKNNFIIQKDNIQYIPNKYNQKKNNEIKREELLIVKNTNIELKKDINYMNNKTEKGKLKELLQNETNQNEDNLNNSLNNNSNNSNNSHSHPININGSIFTVGGNAEQEKSSVKTINQESDKEDSKTKNFVYVKKTEFKNRKDSLKMNQNLNEESKNDMYKIENENVNDNDNENYEDKDLYNKYNKRNIYENNNYNEYLSKKKYLYYQKELIEEQKNKNCENNEKLKTRIDYQGSFFDENNDKNYMMDKNMNNNTIFNNYNNHETQQFMHENLKDKYQKFNNRENNKINNKEKNFNFENNYNNNNYYEKEKNSSGKKTSSSNFDYEEIISNLPNNNLNMNMNMNLDMNNKEYSFNSIKNNNSVNLFLDYVDNILKHENICLILKESLSLREDVTFKELFCLFDYHQNKNISIHEFKKVCKNILSLYPTTDQIGLIFTRYDINKDEKLNLREFLNMICPIKKEYLGILFGDKKIKKPFHSELSEKSKKIIVNLMKTIILNESNYYEIKEKMKNSDFNTSDLWHTLMEFSKSKNSLDHHEFGRFLKSNSYHLTSYEIEVIFNKFDFDKDDFISFDDFNHEFSA